MWHLIELVLEPQQKKQNNKDLLIQNTLLERPRGVRHD